MCRSRQLDTAESLFVNLGYLGNPKYFRLLIVTIYREAVVCLVLSHELWYATKPVDSETFIGTVGL